jgi:hypothetical protein
MTELIYKFNDKCDTCQKFQKVLAVDKKKKKKVV